ncbi:cellulose biosynthesis protein BcsG [Salmonella enterica subsp. enterica]|nr:cellulose biosynthesis protein BcsG [Salmonella enterica subsp. enterica]
MVNHRIPDFINQPITECYLFDNLAGKLPGLFTQHLMMDHNGEFGGFLKRSSRKRRYAERTDEQSACQPAVTARRYI